ncbi:MAG: septum formation initiator family protein [Patescibacteria group bacterium]|nr:septum formation initiator family protein [Patescibacteria group bacterium]
MPRKRKSPFIKIISSNLFIVASIAVLIFLGVSLSKEMIRRHQISQRINSLESEIEALEESNTELSDLIDYLKSDEFREKEARLKMGLKKEDENVIVVPNLNTNENINKSTKLANNSNQAAENIEFSNLKKWWRYFFN